MSRPSRAAAPDALSIGADSRVAVAEASAAPATWTQPASGPSSGAPLKLSPPSDSGPAELARGPPEASPGGAAPTTPRPAASWAHAAAVALVLSTTFFLSHLFGEWAWLGSSKEARVWCYGWLTAASTGLGAIPFWFVREMRPSWIAICNALAGGMMIAASLGMIKEGIAEPDPASLEPILPHWASVLVGFVLGIVFVKMTQGFLEKHEDLRFGSMAGLDARRVLLIVAVMTLHSLTEGVGIGVAFGGANGNALGSFISAMLAIHNVPEGLAVCLVLVPRGVPVLEAALWSVLTSAPQPIMSVPAVIFVDRFLVLLPIGLGFAAGAMLWVAIFELAAEAHQEIGKGPTAALIALSCCSMWVLQHAIRGEAI